MSEMFTSFSYKKVAGLTDELKSIYISEYFNKSNHSILLVCNSLFEANKLYQSIKNYTEDILFFPMDDFMTSEVLAISPDFKMTRLETLSELKNKTKKIVITNLMGYLRFLPPVKLFIDSYITLEKDLEIDINSLVNKLYNIGYKRETIINKTGEMAVRGFVVDIFPNNAQNPIRIEFWGDQIDSIRKFDVNTQLTIENIDKIDIVPNSEFLINKDIDREYNQREIIDFVKPNSIYDYLENPLLIYNNYDEIKISYNKLIEDMFEYCVSADIPTDTKFCFQIEEIENESILYLEENNIINPKENEVNYISYKIEEKFDNVDNINKILEKYLKKYKTIVICVSNRYQANKIIDEFNNEKIIFTNYNDLYDSKINIIVYKINEGYIFNNFVFISENEIFNKKNNHLIYKTNLKYGTRIKDITKLEIGDYIVHNVHGIGRYLGIKTITKNDLKKDYLQLEYRGGDSLYIPVEKIELISKYSSKEGVEPKVNKLGSGEWEKIKFKAKSKARDIANQLLKLYAERSLNKGFRFERDDENQIAFEKEFPYTETEDQIKVLDEIKNDMESSNPMDRLLCGDVGYGKTEVAFRAAFKAILSGKQVALLCPTTILSNQHFQNALERFKSFPINVRLLNRFVTTKQTNKIYSEIKEGKVDFVIGTHKLLNKNIVFKDLGLLIVDEEQRFGVTHKERIKELKNNVDVLTLSATPIPRTLQMSLSGIRGLSIIETPPKNRYPVQTYVLSYNEKIIKEAIYKELSRNGQVFILYNSIKDMEEKVLEIQKLSKDARVVHAHGRMDKTELEDIMIKFINKEYDVLICTTIIETGIDIPNVNTLIIIDADKFGLSQLYQLRGRVGRADRLAYCYLMYTPSKILTEIAKKRLNAIKEFTELGSGFSIAMRDLAIRGAGDILGSEQAGFIDSVGIELFMKMLNQEIDKLNGKYIDEEEKENNQPLIDVDTAIEDSYVKEEELKIEIHKKINEIDSLEKLEIVKKELEDRFGKLSENMLIYMYQELFEYKATAINITQIKQTKNAVEIVLKKNILNKINGEKLFINTIKINSSFKFNMFGGNLTISLNTKNLDRHFIYYLIDLIDVIKDAIKD